MVSFKILLASLSACILLNCGESHYFYEYIPEGSSICFIGDSITAGSKERLGWYKGLDLDDYNIYKLAFGGIGVGNIAEILETYPEETQYVRDSEYIVIAIGANDLRWSQMSPTNGNKFVSQIDDIIKLIGRDKKYIIVSPWYSFEEDDESQATVAQKNELSKDIDKELEKYCDLHNYLYSDTYSILKRYSEDKEESYRSMLNDFIHPSTEKGIYFYSDVFLEALDKKYKRTN